MNYFKRLLGKRDKKFLFTTRNLADHTGNGERILRQGGNNGGIIFSTVNDFAVESWGSTATAEINASGVLGHGGSGGNAQPKQEERKAVEPKAVFHEIKTEDPGISFDNLDEKIKVVEDRLKVLKEHLDEKHLMDEHRALFYLKNRRTYLKTMKKTPFDWAMTTQDAVDDLCKRYKLRVVPLKQYYTLVPKDGIKEMERYTKAYKAVTGDTPIFELVIKEAEMKSEEQKKQQKKDRDPILLANSPLGNSMFVLGAWDDEVEIVDEIIYGMK